MEDGESTATDHEVQNHLAAAAKHIMMALKACRNLTDDTKKVLSDLNSCLPNKLILGEYGGWLLIDSEEQIKHYGEVIMRWETELGMIWDHGDTEASSYLNAVTEIQKIVKTIGSHPMLLSNGKQKELSLRAHHILQRAMSKLKQELMHILIQHKQCFAPEYMSFRSHVEDAVYDESFISVEEDVIESLSSGDDSGSSSDKCLVNLIHPKAISSIKSIASVMFASEDDKEFCRSFVNIRKDALEEYLAILRMEQLTMEDTLKMDQNALSCEGKKWVWALRIIIRVYLRSERCLCDQILGEFGRVSPNRIFIEIAGSAMWQFINFGEAIAMGTPQPERLFLVLDMYEVLADLMLDIDSLFNEETGSRIGIEFHELLSRLADYAKGSFSEFRNCVVSDRPRKPFSSGIHRFTNYTMNYLKTLITYRETLNFLLHDLEADGLDCSPEPENGEEISSYVSCPLAQHARLLASLLQENLENRSKFLKGEPMQHIFLMNNINYMVQKIKDSELRQYFGDEWIRRLIGNLHRHANDYIRTTWSSALLLLKDHVELDVSPFHRPSHRSRCNKFIAAFEEIYKSQTGWVVPDSQLREDLHISTSQKVIQAYRGFIGRNFAQIGDQYIRYNGDELENLVLDFFEGSTRSLGSSRRR
ncbi:hypothetical protein SAY86_016627 [Trapa natans]|uniref:Exocyst subunit Exo70 family protein n=1 Tax=Trapa natans TaxID=22666 RepID=A0AAN7R020_TRANT|nr:hypothetical protein SAY86_016627 [Trapa natans]